MIYRGKAEKLQFISHSSLAVTAAAYKYLHWQRPALTSGRWGCVCWPGPCGTEDGRRPGGRPKGCFYHNTAPKIQNETSLLCSSALRWACFSFTSPLARISCCVLSGYWCLRWVLSGVSPLEVYAWFPLPSSSCLPLVFICWLLSNIFITTLCFQSFSSFACV